MHAAISSCHTVTNLLHAVARKDIEFMIFDLSAQHLMRHPPSGPSAMAQTVREAVAWSLAATTVGILIASSSTALWAS